jgi:peptidoglycan hydrolase-like protein with peptidoglycan-binding domain
VSKPAEISAFILAQLTRPGAITGAAFLAIGAAIATNALLLQPRPHPAPLFSTRRPSETPASEKGDPLVRDVQEALSQSGRYSGPLDGIAGPQTAAAIESFEQATGRAPTGKASADLLAAIRAGGAQTQLANATAAASDAPPPPPDPLVVSVQNALALSAYGPLIADGVVGEETRASIMRFQRDHDLPVTGEISDGLVIELRAIGAMPDK